MAYTLPTFNLKAAIWQGTHTPFADPADLTDMDCQKYYASRNATDVSPPSFNKSWELWHPPVDIRFPRDVGIFTNAWPTWDVSILEVPEGSGQYYRTCFQEIVHEGFPNEYALVRCAQCDIEGKAIQPSGTNIPSGYGVIEG